MDGFRRGPGNKWDTNLVCSDPQPATTRDGCLKPVSIARQRHLGAPNRLPKMLSSLVGNEIEFTAQVHVSIEPR